MGNLDRGCCVTEILRSSLYSNEIREKGSNKVTTNKSAATMRTACELQGIVAPCELNERHSYVCRTEAATI